MKFQNIIFYFGESKECSNIKSMLKKALPNTEIKSISKMMSKEKLNFSDYERVGFIIPLEKWEIPKEVEEFFTKVELKRINYTFAVITNGILRGKAISQIDELLIFNGLYLNYGMYINDCNSHFVLDRIVEKVMRMDDYIESEGLIYKSVYSTKDVFVRLESMIKRKVFRQVKSVNSSQ